MTILVYRNRHRQFGRIRKIYTTPPAPSNLVVKRWPNRWLRKRARVQPYVLRRARIRYPIAGPPAGYIAYKRTPFLRPKIKRWRRFTRKIYSIAGPPASFIAYKRPPRPKIRRAKRFVRKIFPFLPVKPLLFVKRRLFKIKHRTLRMRQKLYPIAPLPVGFIAYKRPPRPKIKRAKRFLRKVFPFLPAGPLIWKRPRFLRPNIRRRRKFILARKYFFTPAPVSFVHWKKPPRPKIRRGRWDLRRFRRRFYQFLGNPVTKKITDWLTTYGRRRGRRRGK